MASRKCLMCKEDKSLANFVGVRTKFLGGAMPICRSCIAKEIGGKEQEERWNVVDKLCQLADIPFVPEEFEKMYKAHGTDAFGTYCAIFRDKQYETIDWRQYNQAYFELKEVEKLEDSLPSLREEKKKKLIRRWGPEYDDQSLEYLENLYQGIVNTVGTVGALNEDQVLKLCKISLIIEEKIRAGIEIDKDLKSYDNLCKLAGVTTQAIKEGTEFQSIGELCSFLEKKGFKPTYYNAATRDEVDKSMKDIMYWNRYLYINEPSIGDEITERINNLKNIDKATDSSFDWGEYNNFAAEIDPNETFQIEL